MLTILPFFFAHGWSFSAYSGKVCLIRALKDCRQRNLTVSKQAPTVSKKTSGEIRVAFCTTFRFEIKNLSGNFVMQKCHPNLVSGGSRASANL